MSTLNKFKKSLRLSQTNAEHFLWRRLRNRYFCKYKFRRQHILQGYIVDFVCLEKKLVIELDGGQHATKIAYDTERSLKLKQDGFEVLRFWNHDVLKNTDAVLRTIYNFLNSPS